MREKKITREVFEFLLRLCEQLGSRVSWNTLSETHGDIIGDVLASGFLKQGPNRNTVLCLTADDEFDVPVERDGTTGRFQYFHPEAGFRPVNPDQLRQYDLGLERFITLIAAGIGVPASQRVELLLEDLLWDLGDVQITRRTIPIFFVRRLDAPGNYERVHDALGEIGGRTGGLVMTSSRRLNRHIDVPGGHRIVQAITCMKRDSRYFEVDRAALSNFLGFPVPREGFSSDFRTAIINGESYRFTKKQAAVIEYLHQAGTPVHKNLLLAQAADTDQKNVIDLFRGGGKNHPAWGTLIRHDNRGHYWLEY